MVSYTADNGGYRADIRYDSDEMQEQSNNGFYVTKGFPQQVSPSIKRPANLNSSPNSFSSNLLKNANSNKKISDKISDSPLLHFNEIRTFGGSSSTTPASSYETVENTDEELFPYSKKLLDDVNYLLKYVTPTIEPQRQDDKKFVDFSKTKFLNDDPFFKKKYKDQALRNNDKFELPPNFPYQFSKFEEPKFEKLSFNGPNLDEHMFIEPSLNAFKQEEPTKSVLNVPKFENPRQESHRGGHVFETFRSKEINLPSVSNEQNFDRLRFNSQRESQKSNKFNFNNDNNFKYNAPEEQRFGNSNFQYSKYNTPKLQEQRIQIPNFDAYNNEETKHETQNDGNLKQQELKFNFQQFGDNSFEPPQYENQALTPPRLEGTQFDNQFNDASQYNTQNLNDGGQYSIPNLNNAVQHDTHNLNEESHYNTHNLNDQPHYNHPNLNDGAQYNAHNLNEGNQYNVQNLNDGVQPNAQHANNDGFNGPSSGVEIPKFNTDSNSQTNFDKVEIPQYIHIHRYEASGEDQSNNARPKELIYYNPLQISVPNSIAYMEQGSFNNSNSQSPTLIPSYITMTEHPRIRPTQAVPHYNNFDIPNFVSKLNITPFRENHVEPTPNHPFTLEITGSREIYNNEPKPLNPPTSNQITTEHQSVDDHGNYENTIMALPPFDPRTYSGYFDFLPSSEVESEGEKHTAPESAYPSTTENSEIPKNELPQYYYDYSTATPINKYVSSAEASQEQFKQGFDLDPIRNSTFLASAYLRPLHKERVYIHHNSLPTTPAEENYNFIPSTTIGPKQAPQNEADVQIIKSISSTIPPELLKDFDYQLSSRFSDTQDANSDNREIKTAPESHPKLNRNIVKKLQSALATNAKVYFKTPSTSGQQKRVVR